MSESKVPAFSSPDLQQAISDARGALEGFDDARNQVSADIKQLEAYLESLGLKSSFRHALGKEYVNYDDQSSQQVAMSLEFGGSAAGIIREEALVWTEGQGGRFRLMFEVTEWDGSVDVDIPGGPYFWDVSTQRRETRPLIESKFETRKRMYGNLPDFVKALAAHLKVDSRPPSVRLFEEMKALEEAGALKGPL
jgi:hypothetical protein